MDPLCPSRCQCGAQKVRKHWQWEAHTAQGAHFSELRLLSRALYLRGTPSDLSTTSTSVKMVITFSKGQKKGEKRRFWHHTRICLELCQLLLTQVQHPSGTGDRGRTVSDSSAEVQCAPGVGHSIFKGNTTRLRSQSGNPNPPKWASQDILNYSSVIRPHSRSPQSGKEHG